MCQVFSPLIGPKFEKKNWRRRPEEEVQKRAVRVSFLPFLDGRRIYVQWHAFVTHWPYLVSLHDSGYLKKMKMEQRGRFLRRPRGEPQCHVAPVCQWSTVLVSCSSLYQQFSSTAPISWSLRPAAPPLGLLIILTVWRLRYEENPSTCIPSEQWEVGGYRCRW